MGKFFFSFVSRKKNIILCFHIVGDFKRSKEIKESAYQNKCGYGPLDGVPDCNLYHYYCQLNLYKYLIEENSDFEVIQMWIFVFSDHNSEFKVYRVPNMQNKILKMLQYRRFNLVAQDIRNIDFYINTLETFLYNIIHRQQQEEVEEEEKHLIENNIKKRKLQELSSSNSDPSDEIVEDNDDKNEKQNDDEEEDFANINELEDEMENSSAINDPDVKRFRREEKFHKEVNFDINFGSLLARNQNRKDAHEYFQNAIENSSDQFSLQIKRHFNQLMTHQSFFDYYYGM